MKNCELCGAEFTRRATMIRHMQESCRGMYKHRHKKYKRNRCNYCRKYFSRYGNLVRHQKKGCPFQKDKEDEPTAPATDEDLDAEESGSS